MLKVVFNSRTTRSCIMMLMFGIYLVTFMFVLKCELKIAELDNAALNIVPNLMVSLIFIFALWVCFMSLGMVSKILAYIKFYLTLIGLSGKINKRRYRTNRQIWIQRYADEYMYEIRRTLVN